MSYQTVCEELPLLTRTQLDDIRKRCALLMQNKALKGNSVEEQDWLLEGVMRECQNRGVYISRTFHLKGPRSYASFATKSIAVRELLLECCGVELSPVRRAALGQVCAAVLAELLWRMYNTPPSFDSMMNRIDLVPQALAESYPGYLQSKLLHLVVPYDGE